MADEDRESVDRGPFTLELDTSSVSDTRDEVGVAVSLTDGTTVSLDRGALVDIDVSGRSLVSLIEAMALSLDEASDPLLTGDDVNEVMKVVGVRETLLTSTLEEP